MMQKFEKEVERWAKKALSASRKDAKKLLEEFTRLRSDPRWARLSVRERFRLMGYAERLGMLEQLTRGRG